MNLTVAVLNAGLGDLALGLQMAGFQVIAAYEEDMKAREVHEANIDAPVSPSPPYDLGPRMLPEVDLLAAKLNLSQLLAPIYRDRFCKGPHIDTCIDDFLRALDICCPKAFFLATGASSAKNQQFKSVLQEIADRNFQLIYKVVDVAEVTGIPTAERNTFIIGYRTSTNASPNFPGLERLFSVPLEDFLHTDERVDPWYFTSVDPANIPIDRDGSRVYCWKGNHYAGTNRMTWNHWKIPLIDTGKNLRKMTHREIANLKGFPRSYVLPAHMSRSWLYKKLMFAVNVPVIEKLAKGIACSLSMDHPGRNRTLWFEDLFLRYLMKRADTRDTQIVRQMVDRFDFILEVSNQTIFFELKYYSVKRISPGKVRKLCEQLALPKTGGVILVLTSEVSVQTRQECRDRFGIDIWDVGNLLWLFGEFEEIKSEFVALLDYAVGDIEPTPPASPIILEEIPTESPATPVAVDEPRIDVAQEGDTETRSEVSVWEKRLADIPPGQEQFQKYESFCTDILQYILGDYLSLWETQSRTDDGLHRFDLCCKVKSGVNQDFFDTVRQHFNTKYIVFEFKNYSQKITQKEIYTTEKYLYETALRKVAIIISRQGIDDHALQAIKGSLRENGKLILTLSDRDLLKMADVKEKGDREPAEILSEMLDNLLVHLEK